MKATLTCAVFTLCATVGIASARAQVVDPQFATNQVVRSDDRATAQIAIGFEAGFRYRAPGFVYPVSYGSVSIGNNGYITFGGTNMVDLRQGIGQAYNAAPIIAPFLADVDTRNPVGGTISYGTGVHDGRNAFGVTWRNVAHYRFDDQVGKVNTFQVVLTDRSDTGAGNIDFYLNYGKISWETGDYEDGDDGLGGTSATVGYNLNIVGSGSAFAEFPGSRTPGSFLDGGVNALVGNSNNGRPGQYHFALRDGLVTPAVPEPASWAMMIAGFGVAGATLRHRKGAPTPRLPVAA